jgi:lysophospholipase L1-like esterase
MTKMTSRALVLVLTGAIAATTACSSQSTAANAPAGTGSASTGSASTGSAPNSAAASSGLTKVVFLGDSVAVNEALPLTAAFSASHVGFQSIAEQGGGDVVGPVSGLTWKTLPAQIASAKPTVLVYQITTYDWGTRQQQQAAYAKLLSTVTGAGAKLVFVTMPPIRPDHFYRPHMADLDRAPDVARTVAASSEGNASVLDASAVWGSIYQRSRDGKPDRSTDGIHDCPQGAARFANWLLGSLAKLYPGFSPAPAQAWANTGWSASSDFKGC